MYKWQKCQKNMQNRDRQEQPDILVFPNKTCVKAWLSRNTVSRINMIIWPVLFSQLGGSNAIKFISVFLGKEMIWWNPFWISKP